MAYTKGSKLGKDEEDEILARIKDRFERCRDKDATNRQNQKEDTEFVYIPGKQSGKDADVAKRKLNGDPCMEFPQTKQFVAQVVNDQRQNRPGIRVHAASGEASEEVADLMQGVIRGIEYDSGAEAVYDEGYRHAVVGGRGYWRIVSEYEDPDSFNQKLVIKRIADPLSVDLDPDFQDPDGGDRDYGFVSEVLTKKEFEKKYPKASSISWESDSKWNPKQDEVIIADYYERQAEEVQLVQLADGRAVYADQMAATDQVALDATGKPIERTTTRHKVCWYKVAGGQQILDKFEWPGTIIPIICAMGDEIVIDGRRMYQGLISQAKDTQVLFNFGMSQQAVHLALTPRSPWVGPVAAITGFETVWDNLNTGNYSFAPYNHKDTDGNDIPAPTKTQGATPDSGWLNWTQQMTGLMRSIIGMYENSLGMKGQEVSGKAIKAREMQGDNATFHFLDNFGRAIALTGRILLEVIPAYYDTERIVNIVGEDDVPALKKINTQQVPGATPDDPLRAIADNDLRVGKYAVTVEAGPGYATKRQEMADLMMQLVQAFPQMMQVAGDIVVKMQDIPDADLLAERLKAMLPPQIQALLAAKDAGEDPEKAQLNQQIQQLSQQLQQVQQQSQQQLGQLTQALEQEKADKSASIAASQARQAAAEAGAQNEAARGQNDQQQAMIDLRVAMEKSQAQSDKNFVDLLKVLLPLAMPPQQVAVDGATATAALEANP